MTNVDSIAAVSLKLPTFWTARAEVWFVQAEAQFITRGITNDATKYAYLVAALDQETATRVLDILQAPPSEDRYESLKRRLFDTYTLTEAQRASQLLTISIGDDSPSRLMDRMLALIGSHPPCFLFKELFLRQMSPEIRAHLIRSEISNFRELARAADSLWTSNNLTGSSVYAIQAPQDVGLSSVSQPKNANYVSARPISHSVAQPSASKQPSTLCFYHRKFGKLAKQCRPPCSYQSENCQAGRH